MSRQPRQARCRHGRVRGALTWWLIMSWDLEPRIMGSLTRGGAACCPRVTYGVTCASSYRQLLQQAQAAENPDERAWIERRRE